MAQKTKIEWTATQLPDGTLTAGSTWNMIGGCTQRSAGCLHCYALRDSWRIMHNLKRPDRYNGVVEKVDDCLRWTSRVNLDFEALDEPLRWKKPRMIFVASMSDLFHGKVPLEFIDQVFDVMAQAKQHTFQVLTKRPERMLAWARRHKYVTGRDYPNEGNVWLGVTTENQETANERTRLLLQIDAPVHFVSAEPLLGPIDFVEAAGLYNGSYNSLDWVLIGGESGSKARPFDLIWAFDIVEQCRTANVDVFVKQMGDNPVRGDTSLANHFTGKGTDPDEWPEGLRIREFPEV